MMHEFTFFLMFYATLCRVSAVAGSGSPEDILSVLFGTGESGMDPYTHSGKLSKNEMPGSVRQ
jgi:hypothetical protein